MPRNKTERRRSNSWSFLEYKGIQFGVEVIAVPPAWTSKICHQCLHIGLRSDKLFKCTNETCSWSGDADFNGKKYCCYWGCFCKPAQRLELSML